MWLLNVETRRLEYVVDERAHKYAILSHTWDDEEVTFQDMQGDRTRDKGPGEKGYNKIELTCQQAKKDGLQYAWIDTCCIDKSSSAELSEAISSMFRWYSEADVCYAFLADAVKHEWLSSNCRWFTRGWTLQELIAPKDIKFYDRKWSLLGTKRTLYRDLADITRISRDVLLPYSSRQSLDTFSVATRMSWAAKRQTSRVEDRAYSLLGLFDVNIPLMYGEGQRAFRRLQEEIVRTSTDQSIFAWEPSTKAGIINNSILAASPDDFKEAMTLGQSEQRNSYHLSNNGLEICLPLLKPKDPALRSWLTYGILACRYGDSLSGPVALRLHEANGQQNQSGEKTNSSKFIIERLGISRTKVVPFEDIEFAEIRSITLLNNEFSHKNAGLDRAKKQPLVWVQLHENIRNSHEPVLYGTANIPKSARNRLSYEINTFPRTAWTGKMFYPSASDFANSSGCISFKYRTRNRQPTTVETTTAIVLAFEVSSDMCRVVLFDSEDSIWWVHYRSRRLAARMHAVAEALRSSDLSERATRKFESVGQIYVVAELSIRMGEEVWTIHISDSAYEVPHQAMEFASQPTVDWRIRERRKTGKKTKPILSTTQQVSDSEDISDVNISKAVAPTMPHVPLPDSKNIPDVKKIKRQYAKRRDRDHRKRLAKLTENLADSSSDSSASPGDT